MGAWFLPIALLLAGACGGRAPFQPLAEPARNDAREASVAGRYRGVLEVDGQPFEAQVELEQEGPRLMAELSSPSGLEARGKGWVDGRTVLLELQYGSECSGSMTMDGELVEEGRRIRGRLRARDCTGEAQGSFHLDRPASR